MPHTVCTPKQQSFSRFVPISFHLGFIQISVIFLP